MNEHPAQSGHKPASNTPKGPQPAGGIQQALADKAANSPANAKARVDANHMPDKPPLDHQHTPNSSGRK